MGDSQQMIAVILFSWNNWSRGSLSGFPETTLQTQSCNPGVLTQVIVTYLLQHREFPHLSVPFAGEQCGCKHQQEDIPFSSLHYTNAPVEGTDVHFLAHLGEEEALQCQGRVGVTQPRGGRAKSWLRISFSKNPLQTATSAQAFL